MAIKVDRGAEMCGDQLPIYSNVGRGIEGNSFFVKLKTNTDDTTILQGESYDPARGTWQQEWETLNINGGRLKFEYKIDSPEPNQFQFTISYERVGHPQHNWTWTSPAIPYVDNFNYPTFEALDEILGFETKQILDGNIDNVKEYIDKIQTTLQEYFDKWLEENVYIWRAMSYEEVVALFE